MALAGVGSLAVHRSRKLIPEFRLHRPNSPAEAVALKAAAGADAVFMAGGIDMVNRMKSGAPVTEVIHLGRLMISTASRKGKANCGLVPW